MAVGPFGPWLRPGQAPVEPAHQHEQLPGGVVLLEEITGNTEPEWRVDSAIDPFNAVYREMAKPTKTRRGFSPGEVDEMLVSTVAVLIGAGIDEAARDLADLEQLAARRARGENVNWQDLDEGDRRR